ncbi:MAG: uncharacterized protein QG652_142 [Pseudomonadota bacterium]|nr:uncharacterized protein [Pseudomonadota bacterium]
MNFHLQIALRHMLFRSVCFSLVVTMSTPAIAAGLYSPNAPLDDYRDYSRASTKEILLRNQANGLDAKTVTAIGGSGSDLCDDGIGCFILAAPLLPITMLAMLTGEGMKALNEKWDKARQEKMRKNIGKAIRDDDEEDWIEYTHELRNLEGEKRYDEVSSCVSPILWHIPFGLKSNAALREALIELDKGNFDAYMTILRRGLDIDDFAAAAVYQLELSKRPEQREQYEAFVKRAHERAQRVCEYQSLAVFGNLQAYILYEKGDWSGMTQALFPRGDIEKHIAALQNTSQEAAQGIYKGQGMPPLVMLSEHYHAKYAVMVMARWKYQLQYNKTHDRYGLHSEADRDKDANELFNLISDECAKRFKYAACGTLWYQALNENGFGDSGKPAWFSIEDMLDNSPVSDVVQLALVASTFKGGAQYTVPTIEAWALKKQQPTVFTLMGQEFENIEKFDKAVEWYTKAANAGETLAMRNLAWLYDAGKLGEVDHAKAVAWMEKAATAGDNDAIGALGFRLVSGTDVAVDAERGMNMLSSAAEKDTSAAYLLGRVYAEGISVSKDTSKAKSWLKKAAAAGHEDARKLLDAI